MHRRLNMTKSNITKLTITGYLPTTIDEFRTYCIQDETITCNKQTLHKLLINNLISNIWWDLTYDERLLLSQKLVYYFGTMRVKAVYYGESDCAGYDPKHKTAYPHNKCAYNATIRYLKFNHPLPGTDTDMYWEDNYTGEMHCYTEEEFNLPAYFTEVDYPSGTDHAIVALQLGEDVNDFNNWLFFQYTNTNIQPGDYQMRIPCRVYIYDEKPIDKPWGQFDKFTDTKIAEFIISEE